MPRFAVDVSESAFDRLAEEAGQQRRSLREQAAWLLETYLLGPTRRCPDRPPDCSPSEGPSQRVVTYADR